MTMDWKEAVIYIVITIVNYLTFKEINRRK